MTIESTVELKRYQYGIDVQKLHQMYGMSGKILYRGQWIPKTNDQIIIVEMNETIARHEAFFYRELNNHNYIIRTFGYIENNFHLTIFIQEYAHYGDLSNLIMDNEYIMSQNLLFEIFSQITDAMSYVASKSIVHGDLGCRNVLVYKIDQFNPKEILVKLTDFGLARSFKYPNIVNTDSSIIPIRYCAPEILRNNQQLNYSEKSDVYSMGVFMWEALSNGEIPYSSDASDDIVKRKKLNDERLNRPLVCDQQFWILMSKCWYFQPNQRITFAQMKEELANMNISEVEERHQSILIHQTTIPVQYKLNIDVEMKSCLKGNFGKTYEAKWLSNVNRSSIVLIKFEQLLSDYELLFYTGRYSHRHIVHSYGFVENNLHSFILLQERASYGNLEVLLERKQFQPITIVLIKIFLQIIDAMIYIIEQKLIHGDLQCSNVLVFQMNDLNPNENLVKLKNFSRACPNDRKQMKTRRSIIPVRYCALEILRSAGQSNYSEFSDIYSMGVLMWQACSQGELPYASSNLNSEVRQRKLSREMLIKPLICHHQVWSIIQDCWLNEPSLRCTFSQIQKRLLNIKFDSNEIYKYELDVDVRMNENLSGDFGKKIYQAKWISKENSSIHLLIFNNETSRYETSFYLKLNSHENIVHTFGLVKNRLERRILLQEHAPFDNLLVQFREKQFQPSTEVLIKIFLQIINAMMYMISQNIVHGDLRCENILVFQINSSNVYQNLVKLTNFHLSYDLTNLLMNNEEQSNIPVRYCALEILQYPDQLKTSELTDVYSMGILMWQAFSYGDLPYGINASDRNIRERRLNNEELSKPDRCNEQIWTSIKNCWCKENLFRCKFKNLHESLSKIPLPPPVVQPILPKVNAPANNQRQERNKPDSTPSESQSIFSWVWSSFRNLVHV